MPVSATSLFFFWGSIDDPVVNSSPNVAKENSLVVHNTSSSPMRERCTPRSAMSKSDSTTKSRSLTASIELTKAESKSKSFGGVARINGERAARKRARSQWRHVQSRARVNESIGVSYQCECVSFEMVS